MLGDARPAATPGVAEPASPTVPTVPTARDRPGNAGSPGHPDRRGPVAWPRSTAPGLCVAVAVAAVATLLGRLVPLAGGPVCGIVLGALLTSAVPALRGPRWRSGYAVAARPVLQASIVVLGTGLSLHEVAHAGVRSLPVMLGSLTVALAGAWLLGRLLGVDGPVRTLVGVGTGICGASAIAATTEVVGATQAEAAYAIGTIFTFNVAAVLLFPAVGHLLGMGGHAFGLWSGTAINDTSSVVAAAYSYGHGAGPYGIVVKLTRTLTLVPIVLALALGRRSRAVPWRRVVPAFLVGFLAASALDSLGAIPSGWHAGLARTGTFLVTTALSGIGLSTRVADLRRAGHRPLLLGALLWVAVAASSLGLAALTGWS